jgi:hypothetical protein
MDVRKLPIAIALCAAMAVLGTILAGRSWRPQYAALRKPRLSVPLFAFALVAARVYPLDGLTAYWLLSCSCRPAPSDVYARLETRGINHPYYLNGTCEHCRSRTAEQEGRMVEDAGSTQKRGRIAPTREWAMGLWEPRVAW